MSNFHLRETTESDRTYIARLNYLTDVFGDETLDPGPGFEEDTRFYVDAWRAERGGVVAFDHRGVPAGAAWLNWGSAEHHGFGFTRPEVPEVAIAVEGRQRRRGLGARLLRAATALAQDLGSPAISLCVDEANLRAHALYVREGFVQVRHDVAEGFYVLEKPAVVTDVPRGGLA
ncbi:hypothetical protein B841_08670 [Corynebacterium maris DSM 45190]|uniref:N-acetyltransferase domain-containing protein n=1 Tax=Corynebacterium maris DSM 45190 TaxID=1224163 RepID=S5SVW2_9CORY|nr:GNAT family N-acetyltransferase [Corynebacterium maris]AGS35207.1 hypothetical protein B841_08670 [Corynebacterium maris DSM 45190]